jgi:hypothetical protein
MSKGRTPKEIEDNLNAKLTLQAKRLQQIADIEAKAAYTGGYGSRGEFEAARNAILKSSDEALRRLAELYGLDWP